VAEPSPGRALRAGWPPLAWAALIFWLSSLSRPVPVEVTIPHADKLAHLGAFGVLAALTVRALLALGQGGRRALLVGIAAASLYGALDEWHQSFVPGRDPDPWDWAADTAGAVLGAAAVGLPRRKSRASIRG
jgi:VanZ family protein